ncbi:15236_t:CDS:2, partial [Cetraspora pellucida]
AGSAYNDNEGIFESCEMYNIASDESIFCRIYDYKNNINSFTQVLLRAWHTNKDMMSTIINIFFGNGIFNFAATLDVKYLSNFQKVVEYKTALLILNLLQTSVGITLHLFVAKKQITIDYLLNKWSNDYCSV